MARSDAQNALTLRISRQARKALAIRAAEAGEGVAEYASEILEQAVTKPTIDELLAPVRADFAKTRMTESQILRFGRGLLRKVRQEKRAKSA